MTPREIEAFRTGYAAWFARAKPALDERRWKDAFAGFPAQKHSAIPFAAPIKSLREIRLGLLTTAGLYLKDEQQPFDAANVEGDASYRELPLALPRDRLGIAHDHYDHAAAEQDLNAVYPIERLRELVDAGELGELAPVAISTSGYCTRLDTIAEETAPRIAARMKALGVDAVLHLPV